MRQALKLSDLFKSHSDYLKLISKYCEQYLAESLKKQGYSTSLGDGDMLKEEDFKNWNLTPHGLLLTFDSYEVACYAAGRQQALITYRKLRNALDLAGSKLPDLIKH